MDELPGGLADDSVPSDFDQDQLEKGTLVEMEHVDDIDLAMEIAMDHLKEIPDYYDRLGKMEKEAEKPKLDIYLPEFLIMLDGEFTGVNPETDSLLQVAMLKLKLAECGRKYLVCKDSFNEFMAHDGKPTTEFHNTYLTHVFEACNKSTITPEIMKEKIHKWLGPLLGTVMPIGDCISTDMEFLHAAKCIDRPGFDDAGRPTMGTFHYESFDMNPIKLIARHKIGKKKKFKFSVEHDGLMDCIGQAIEFNYVLDLLLS